MLKSQKLIDTMRQSIEELPVIDAQKRQSSGAVILDVREANELAMGSPRGAIRISRGFLEMRIQSQLPRDNQEILVICGGGNRSLFAAATLKSLGYSRVKSIAGGFDEWRKKDLPIDSQLDLSPIEKHRYQRHLEIPEVGVEGQVKLLNSRVVLIGIGGLGSPIALYLAAAGVGHLSLVDDDMVERSNLQRQVLYRDLDIGRLKVESAQKALQELNPDIQVTVYKEKLTRTNAEQIFAGAHVVVDGSDNFPTRYLVNDICIEKKVPMVHGSVYRFEGQVSVFWSALHQQAPCYRCLFPQLPPVDVGPSCDQAGVLGVLPGVIGNLQAVEVIKILLGIGEPLIGRLLTYNALHGRFRQLNFTKNICCFCCQRLPPQGLGQNPEPFFKKSRRSPEHS